MTRSFSEIYDTKVDYQSEVGDLGEYSLMPDGVYSGSIEAAETVETSKGGIMVKLTIRLDNNRLVWDNLNILCPSSEQAEKFARANMQLIGTINRRTIDTAEDLEGCDVTVRIGTQKGRDGYRDRNVVKGYIDPKAQRNAKSSPAKRPATSSGKTDPRYDKYTQGRPENSLSKDNGAPSEELLDDQIPF